MFDFQQSVWDAWAQGQSGIVHSPTGSGKTLAAWLGPVQHALTQQTEAAQVKTDNRKKQTPGTGKMPARQLQVLWITPLRALATDTKEQLQSSAEAVGCDWTVEIRTGDTSTTQRQRQRLHPPNALVTTPESLSVLLSYAKNEKLLGSVQTVIVDEWHELLGSKRGVQLELCLAHLKTLNPHLSIWGLSATIANLPQALDTLLGPGHQGKTIAGEASRNIHIKTLIPQQMNSFPWAGHLGIKLVEQAAREIDNAESSLLFTNTRSQAELWFENLTRVRPEWLGKMALHHGSIDRKVRLTVEEHLRAGNLKCVVCTSSLDLGVDFSPVDQVLQVGSPKGIARLIQRAGRSGHQPGRDSSIVCIPANAFELVEFCATRRAVEQQRIEARPPLYLCLDVLAQHLVTIALGSGFCRHKQLQEIRQTEAFKNLTPEQWDWTMDFITRGGQALKGYPQFNRVVENNGQCRVPQGRVARMHRMSIGTITGSTTMQVRWMSGGRIGFVEESFISRLNIGSTFLFSGRLVELAQVKDMTAYVRKSKKRRGAVPRWQGGRLPMSSQLADAVLETLEHWQAGTLASSDTKTTAAPELEAIDELLQLQQQWSILPSRQEFLIEQIKLREGYSVFFFPFAGRLVNEGLAMLIAWRLSQRQPATLTLSASDYGFELFSKDPIDLDKETISRLFNAESLLEDLLRSLENSEAAKRQFRDIATIAGLVFQGYPGSGKSSRQIQASSGLIYDVLKNYDAENLLLDQASREVLEAQMEITRMRETLEHLATCSIQLRSTSQLTPLAFPLWADRLQTQIMSSESWRKRVEKMLLSLETAAAKTLHKPMYKPLQKTSAKSARVASEAPQRSAIKPTAKSQRSRNTNA